MIRVLFGDIRTGRLAHLQYPGYPLLVNPVPIALVIGGIFAMGLGEQAGSMGTGATAR